MLNKSGNDEQALPKEKINWKNEIFDWAKVICIATLVAVVIRKFIFTLVVVVGTSMNPTLKDGDKLFVYRLGYTSNRGDIVIFIPPRSFKQPKAPKEYYVKRVIAVKGDMVDIINGGIYVNGQLQSEAYVNGQATHEYDIKHPLMVPENHIYVLGDNRSGSTDSRFSSVGLVDVASVIGKAVFRLAPFSKMGLLK